MSNIVEFRFPIFKFCHSFLTEIQHILCEGSRFEHTIAINPQNLVYSIITYKQLWRTDLKVLRTFNGYFLDITCDDKVHKTEEVITSNNLHP